MVESLTSRVGAVTQGAAAYYTRVITSLDVARALAAEWRELAAHAAGVTPFQDPDWLLPWYEVWAADRVWILTARSDDGALVAMLPCVDVDGRLELAGSGVSDYLAPMLAADDARLRSALDDALASAQRPVCFHDVPRESPWVDMVRDDRRWALADASVCPVVPLAGNADAWRRTLPSGLQRNIRRYGRQIADDAGARLVTASGESDVDTAVAALIELHGKRWHAQHRPGVFASEGVRRFHRLATPPLIRRGVVRLHLLVAGDIIGAQYVLVRRPRAYSYIGGFDPEWRKYSPGSLLMAYAIEQAIAEGCTAFDLLRGAEPYKYTWGAVDQRSVTLLREPGRD